MQNTFVESMKTIAKLAIDKAGFDKTRTGKIVAVNSVTNTYSVKVDGIIYNNVKTVNDSTYNVGDTVKVNIPMNNPSQSYIASSILSDESFGNKIAQATSAIDAVDQRIDSIVEIMGKIYQLSIGVTYATRTVGSGATRVEYTDATYTAILTQDGENVTQSHDNSEFNWYLEKTTGKTNVGTNTKTITLSSEQYLYGQSVVLEWSYQGEVKLRARVTLFNENAVQQIAKYATEITTGGVFVHRADGIYDVGANWESPNAYGVKIAESVDIVKGGEIYGSFGGTYITIGNTSASKNENNILLDNSNNKIQLRKGATVLSEISSNSVIIGQTSTNYYNTYMDSSNLYFRKGNTILGQISSSSIILGQNNSTSYNTLINTEGIKLRYGSTNLVNLASGSLTLGKTDTDSYNTYITSSGINLRKGTTTYASITSSAITLGATSTYNTYITGGTNGALTFRNGTTALATFDSSTIKLGQNSLSSKILLCGNNFYMKAGTSAPQGDSGIFYWIGCDSSSYSGTNQQKQIAISTLTSTQTAASSWPSKYALFNTYVINGMHIVGMEAWGSGSGEIGSQVYCDSDGSTYIAGNKGIDVEVGSSSDFVVVMSSSSSYYEMIKVHNYSNAASGNKWRVYFPHSYGNNINSGRSVKLTEAGALNTNSSSRKHKKDIVYEIKEELNPQKLYDLPIAQFKFKDEYIEGYNVGKDLIGIIAEDIDKIYHFGAYHETDGTPADWDERILIPAMLKLIQEQHQEIEKIKSKLLELQGVK